MAGGASIQSIQISDRDKAIEAYYRELNGYEAERVTHEKGLRSAFHNLLAHFAPQVKWVLIDEVTIKGGAIPDGVLRDASLFYRGYWEAKDLHDNLDAEIAKKIARGYPTDNIIFENTQRAVLYQDGRKVLDIDMRVSRNLVNLLETFFNHQEKEIERFERAVEVFRERIPDLARELQKLIQNERETSPTFRAAFEAFYQQCQSAVDPKISQAAVEEMLVQHLLTERLIRTIFDNPDFTQQNVIAQEIEKVIRALTARTFNRNEFMRALDPYYRAVEEAARLATQGADAWADRQRFLNMVYERFFQGYSVRQADTHGIVYTPQEIVDFMVASVDEVLKREFGMAEGIGQPGVKILDPATGTGNFVVNILRRIPTRHLKQKYTQDLFCNEIMLLPYYIACLNIEHAYYERMGEYLSFEGACFADTLDMAEHVAKSSGGEHIVARPLMMMTEENTTRVERERAAEVMVVIGNPPYNVGQVNENDNNKNRQYPVIDGRIRETYAKDSHATLKNKLYDPYVKFFRWATDRLRGRDGIVCLVTNNSFVDQIAFDGMRKYLEDEFTTIYHLDLHGNVRQNPKISGTSHNVFGIQVGVGITIAVRKAGSEARGLYYLRVPEDWRRERKLWHVAQARSLGGVEWQKLLPDEKHTWLTEGMQPEFETYLPISGEDAKLSADAKEQSIFGRHSNGVKTNRDSWVYGFDRGALERRVRELVESYNSEVDRWHRRTDQDLSVDDFVLSDDKRIKWSGDLKDHLARRRYATFASQRVRWCLYRPFTTKYLFFDPVLNNRRYLLPYVFPIAATGDQNVVLVVSDRGHREPFSVLAALTIPDLHLLAASDGFQCFPLYTYDEDGTNRRENITEWALEQFRAAYGPEVTKRHIFDYVYGLLHHPAYRERYAENLKRELPRIPLVAGAAAFGRCAEIGRRLMEMHLGYERQPEYDLRWVEHPEASPEGRVTFAVGAAKMKLSADRTALTVNPTLTLEGIPPECFEYRLGNRSALEWVIDQYHISEDKRSGIVSDPNRPDDPQYIVRLVGQVITVSVETVKLVRQLAAGVALPIPDAAQVAAN